jgi:hypothetical protein
MHAVVMMRIPSPPPTQGEEGGELVLTHQTK